MSGASGSIVAATFRRMPIRNSRLSDERDQGREDQRRGHQWLRPSRRAGEYHGINRDDEERHHPHADDQRAAAVEHAGRDDLHAADHDEDSGEQHCRGHHRARHDREHADERRLQCGHGEDGRNCERDHPAGDPGRRYQADIRARDRETIGAEQSRYRRGDPVAEYAASDRGHVRPHPVGVGQPLIGRHHRGRVHGRREPGDGKRHHQRPVERPGDLETVGKAINGRYSTR